MPVQAEKENPSFERRVAPRYKVNLKAPVIILVVKQSEDGAEQFLPLQGRTRDVSLSGLAVVISNKEMDELERFGTDCTMRLVLPLPSGAIDIEAAPVRFQPLSGEEGQGTLIGARITNMPGRDRILFMEFIQDIADGNE
jgi:hypothetical protein